MRHSKISSQHILYCICFPDPHHRTLELLDYILEGNGVVVAIYADTGAGSKHWFLLQYIAASFGAYVSIGCPTFVYISAPGLFIPVAACLREDLFLTTTSGW